MNRQWLVGIQAANGKAHAARFNVTMANTAARKARSMTASLSSTASSGSLVSKVGVTLAIGD
ncbi:MAG: hypothetical protein WBC92_06250 [Terracidiphilus sp.]